MTITQIPWIDLFQSTLPVRGATYKTVPPHRAEDHFNPRSPCGERQLNAVKLFAIIKTFQSTLPVRGATKRTSSSS